MNIYDIIAIIALLTFFVGLFYLLFKKGKRKRGGLIAAVACIVFLVFVAMSGNRAAVEDGFENATHKNQAAEMGMDADAYYAWKGEQEAAVQVELEKKQAMARAENEAREKEAAAARAVAEEATKARAAEQAEIDSFFAPPPEQVEFVKAISEAEEGYRAAENELAKGGVRRQRAKSLCSIVGNGPVKGWTGTLEDLSTNGDGLGVISIRLSDSVSVKTSNNSLSDGLLRIPTLIDPDTSVFQSLSTMKEGDRVKFAGRFVPPLKSPAPDCFHEVSMSMAGAMTDAEFMFAFSSVEVFQPD